MASDASEWPALEDSTSARLILRDGSVATVRQTVETDSADLAEFFRGLSAESRHNRFFTSSPPPESLIRQFSDSSDPARAMTLMALRDGPHGVHPIAVASYLGTTPRSAEVAFAVSDGMHGKGLATALLERLAAIAQRRGIDCFEATTKEDNREMLEVFRDSGFEMRSKSAAGVVDVRLDLTPSAWGSARIDERNRVATVASLEPILHPRTLAVVGVSRDPSNLGRRIHDALLRYAFQGRLYAVNPHVREIGGRISYESVAALSEPMDLVVIAVPQPAVLQTVEDCAKAGAKALVIVTAGFAEVNDEGRALQERILATARTAGMRLIGPNCMGVLNTDPAVRLNASFSEHLPPAGRVSIASQSGGVGLALLQLAAARRVGVSSFVSLGNKADVSGNDLLQWGESDPRTSVVLLYLESFGNPRRFAQLARRIARKKPIVVVKAGRTTSGSRAAGSHTAGLASNEAAVTALFEQSGVVRADTIDEMFDIAQCFDLQPLPQGPRVGIVTNAGGPGILAADACEAAGLTVAPFGPGTRAALAQALSSNASTANPVDLVASAGAAAYEHAIGTALRSPDVDSLVVIYTPIQGAETDSILAGIGRAVAEARRAGVCQKPVLACTLSVATQPAPLPAGDELIPAYVFPENAARALGHAVAHAAWRNRKPALFRAFDDVRPMEARALCQAVVEARGDTWLTAEELRRVLNAFGLTLINAGHAHCEDDAASAAAVVGIPVALKIESEDILHKTEAGGVRLDLRSEQEVRAAFREMAQRFPGILDIRGRTKLLVQPMVRGGVETLIGVNADHTFGPLVAFGLGGVATEVLRDVAFRLAPLTERDAEDLIHGVRGYRLLQGYRGAPPADTGALEEMLLRVSMLAQHVPELRELDLNPVIALPEGQGCRIVDARARVAGV